ncbi:sensor domain-containing diguanylate cyclase [Aquibacillus rhizosphaerae]|uniref:Sensor domain-containing diguanylate cyclase n=1 Tax=Aquibacillus rhizosphaerae TaxID=3051431 RepID=A0ABT7L7A4_9BACI|nr:sensor domain-containing diguanylate cyclase [Aquibacillus sp. LR5S19]MDL4841728.1 sensor domain-containing diguanylate cyclase [Aquibacillus sp. LR5S19]
MCVSGREPLLIENTKEHPFTCDLPITFEANIGSYVGVPVFYQDGELFGTLCAVDSKTSKFTQDNIAFLSKMSQFFSYVLELEQQANYDSLTNLHNRNYLYKMFDTDIGLSSSSKGTIMFMDLDGFKGVNDEHGHEFGDSVLEEVGNRIRQYLSNRDIGVRIGGDEFVLVFQDLVDKDVIERKAKSLLETMSDWTIYNETLNLTTSIGITMYSSTDVDIRSIIKKSDIAMYKAKKLGKNNYKFF